MGDDKKGVWVVIALVSIGLGIMGGAAVFASLAVTLSVGFVAFQFFNSSTWEYRKWPKLAGQYQIAIPCLTRYSSVCADVVYRDSTVPSGDGFFDITNIYSVGTDRNIWGDLSLEEKTATNRTIQDHFDKLFSEHAARIHAVK